LGSFKARWGIGRMHYTVEPGLYALGTPDEQAPILVTASYKMSLDRLRESLPDRSAWVLVLDTQGINVWCSAGKGTFGTVELVGRIQASGLSSLVTHRKLILPQLSGPGVAAHQVKKLCGFKVIYGPVRSADLPAFLDAGLKASPEMRVKTFPIWERVGLIPVELVSALKAALIIAPLLLLISGLVGPDHFLANVTGPGLFAVTAILTAIMAGAVLTPLLLPWLPGRAFSLKGLLLGLLAAVGLFAFKWADLASWESYLEVVAWFMLIPAVATYLAMNFTGASTCTSLSGVKKEMRWAVPLQAGVGLAGLGLWIGSLVIA
jgi:acetyl-CoA decarbonylase/synthase complex subunit gamma